MASSRRMLLWFGAQIRLESVGLDKPVIFPCQVSTRSD